MSYAFLVQLPGNLIRHPQYNHVNFTSHRYLHIVNLVSKSSVHYASLITFSPQTYSTTTFLMHDNSRNPIPFTSFFLSLFINIHFFLPFFLGTFSNTVLSASFDSPLSIFICTLSFFLSTYVSIPSPFLPRLTSLSVSRASPSSLHSATRPTKFTHTLFELVLESAISTPSSPNISSFLFCSAFISYQTISILPFIHTLNHLIHSILYRQGSSHNDVSVLIHLEVLISFPPSIMLVIPNPFSSHNSINISQSHTIPALSAFSFYSSHHTPIKDP